MSPYLIGITIVLYAAILLLSSWLSARKAGNREFFGSKKGTTHWSIVGVAMISAAMSGITFISIPGSVAANSFSYLQMTLGFILGNIFITFVLIPIFYKTGVVSLYEYLRIRFGANSHLCGACFFTLSKLLNTSLRTFVVSAVLQPLLFEPIGIPFWVNATLTMLLVWLYTNRGGVKSVIWADVLKTICLVGSIVFCIIFIIRALGVSYSNAVDMIASHPYSQTFFFDNIDDRRYFFKQLLAGFFMIIATTGLDQDVMQRVLNCRTRRESQRNMLISIVLQTLIIFLLLSLGVLLYIYVEQQGYISIGEGVYPLSNGTSSILRPDQLFGAVATSESAPAIFGVMFILALVAATYSSAGSALTSLTTSFTIDIVGATKHHSEERIMRIRKVVHLAISVAITLLMILFYHLTNDSSINTFYKLASYTYGPILGLFLFGITSKRKVRDGVVPIIAIISPLLSLLLDNMSVKWFGGYEFSFELLLVNALITIVGLYVSSINFNANGDKNR